MKGNCAPESTELDELGNGSLHVEQIKLTLLLSFISKQVAHAILTINTTRENMLNRANSDCELCGIAGSAI